MKNSTQKAIGVFSASLLVTAAAVYAYSPVIGSHADSSATADINVTVGEVMSLTLSTDALNLSTNPNSFVSGVVSATTSTNSQYGYTLTLEDVDDNTNMVHSNENINAVVVSNFSGTKTSTTMDNNTWGYSLDATDFSKIPVNGSAATIKTTNVPMTTASETTDVTFGAKVGNLTSGTYTDKVLFTMYTNGQPEEPTMQGFSCDSLENIGDSTTLKDSRDGNMYTVKKLKDGKCWMTENLRLADYTMRGTDSDIPEIASWYIPASSTTGFDQTNKQSVYIDSTYGGLYSYYAATAASGGSSYDSGTANYSICPKGWRLPTGGNGNTSEYKVLTDKYPRPENLEGEPGFVYSGYMDYGTFYHKDYYGRFWSASISGENDAYSLYMDSSMLLPGYMSQKSLGYAVRCVARQ